MSGAEVLRRWFEDVWNQQRDEAIEELLAPDAKFHALWGGLSGPAGFRQFAKQLRSQLDQPQFEVTHLVEQGDHVAVRCIVRATHRPSGRAITFDGGGFVRVEQGKIAEAWDCWNFLALAQQIGDAPEHALRGFGPSDAPA